MQKRPVFLDKRDAVDIMIHEMNILQGGVKVPTGGIAREPKG